MIDEALGTLYQVQSDVRRIAENVEFGRYDFLDAAAKHHASFLSLLDALQQLSETRDWKSLYLAFTHYGPLIDRIFLCINQRCKNSATRCVFTRTRISN